MPALLEDHFWLICAIWAGGFGAVLNYRKLRPYVRRGLLSEAECRQLAYGWLLVISVPSIAFWLLQISISEAVGVSYYRWPAPQKWIATAIVLGSWLVLLRWVWWKGGAAYLGRIMEICGYPRFLGIRAVAAIRLLSLAIVGSSAAAMLIEFSRT